MEKVFDAIVSAFLIFLLCLVTGMISYGSAEQTMKQRAIDAGVACYVTGKESGSTTFKFNCDKENK